MLHRYSPLKKVNKVDKFLGGSHVTCLLLFLLSISTTASRPSLYSSDFYSLFLFIYFSLVSLSFHILWLHVRTSDDLFWRYIMVSCKRPSGDPFCTHTSTSWPNLFIKTFSWLIQYINLFMLNFFCISTTSLSVSLYIRDFFGLICLLRDFKFTWNYFKAACTYLWWLIQYKNLRLVTYSIYISMELFDCLFFTHTSLCWPIFCKYHIFMT